MAKAIRCAAPAVRAHMMAPGGVGVDSVVGGAGSGANADGTAASTAQGGQTMSWGRDPARRIVSTALTGSGTDVNHYAGEGDSPAWVSHADGGFERVVTGPAGGVSVLATTTAAGATTAVLQIGDPHGDVVATAALAAGRDVTAADVVLGSDFDEYGVNGTTTAMPASPGYGWEGVNARSASTTPGLVLMGARLYNPATGRFLTLDPVPGGNANPYTYPADPVNAEDLDGEWAADPKIVSDCGAAGWGAKQARCVALSVRVYLYAEGAGRPVPQNNDVEAMRHVMWSMMLSWSIGEHSARRVLARHEKGATDRADSKRDRRNNRIGLAFANRFRGFAAWNPGYWNPNRVGLAKAIYDDERWHGRVWCKISNTRAARCSP